tara:strand:- start:1635 stop:2390 length:756 start_codon:yes stop_codon:yes gene_type:complete
MKKKAIYLKMKFLKKTFIILGIFVANIIIYYVLVDYIILPKISKGNVEVYLPDFKGQNIDSVLSKDYDFIFEVNNREYIEGYFPGEIISMIPRSFTKVKSGKIVKLTVMDKPKKYTVDNFKGRSLRDVKLLLDRKNIKVDTIFYEFNEIIKKNYIISQYPQFGEKIDKKNEITLIVSKGNPPDYYIVPNIVNLSLAKAKAKLLNAGLFLGTISYEFNNELLNNTIIEQSQPPDKRLSFPANINVVLSKDKR